MLLHRTRRLLAITLVVGAPFALGACGGSDKSGGTPVEPVAGVLSKVTASITDPTVEIGQGTLAAVDGKDGLGGGVSLGTRTITWISSNPAIATVTNSGAVNTVGVGAVTLTVSVQNGTTALTASTPLTVTKIADAPTTTDVAMAPQVFIPSQSVVKLGGTVRFFFAAIDHNVIWGPRLPGSPADILVTTNATVSRTFNTVGVYGFDCTVHPGMSGRVIVSP
jgi:plastocyanin